MNRRNFLRAALLAAGAGASWRLWAAPGPAMDARLILVFLRGAYDGLSLLAPYREDFYYEARPTIALARPDESDPLAGVALNEDWALHPALTDSLLPLYQAGQAAFVAFAGTEFVSRSHFQAQDWVEAGMPADGRMNVTDGFLNRLSQRLGATAQAVSFTQALPLVLRGSRPVANTPVRLPAGQMLDGGDEDLLLRMYQGHALQPLVEEGLGLRREIARELAEEMQAASRSAVPASGFALEAGRIAHFLGEQPQYAMAFMDVGGWDTHANQGGAQGALANRMANLGRGMAAMADGLGKEWDKTLVVVISEFGRTFRENGTKGTDHGHGNVLWVLGGGLRGGRIAGEQMRLRAGELHQDRDVPVLNDYRNVLASLFGRMYGLSVNDQEFVFPGCAPRDLGLL